MTAGRGWLSVTISGRRYVDEYSETGGIAFRTDTVTKRNSQLCPLLKPNYKIVKVTSEDDCRRVAL